MPHWGIDDDRSPGPPCWVWVADLAEHRAELFGLLDVQERSRYQNYRQPDDRRRFALGVALLKLAVGRETGAEPTRVVVERACPDCARPHGRPVTPGAHVSVSHSGRLVAVAVTRAAPVGIDVEALGRFDDSPLDRLVLAADEVSPPPGELVRLWCRKEAVVKATGDGLRVPLNEVIVSPVDAPARLISYRGLTLDCALRDLDLPPAYAGAVAVLDSISLELRMGAARELLD